MDFDNADCLDLFSGTGSISYELVSRGAKTVTAVDQNRSCLAFLEATASKLGIENLITVKSDVIRFLKNSSQKFDLIFADPPYDLQVLETVHEIVFTNGLKKKTGLLVLEHSSRDDYSALAHFSFTRKYGNVGFSFFSNLDPEV